MIPISLLICIYAYEVWLHVRHDANQISLQDLRAHRGGDCGAARLRL